MTPYFTATVSSVGTDARDLIEGGVVILFGDPCPDALAEVSVVHRSDENQNPRDPEPGDRFWIGDSGVTITRVGEIAGNNLRDLGHIVVYLNVSEDESLLPGAVHAEGSLAVPAGGEIIRFEGGE